MAAALRLTRRGERGFTRAGEGTAGRLRRRAGGVTKKARPRETGNGPSAQGGCLTTAASGTLRRRKGELAATPELQESCPRHFAIGAGKLTLGAPPAPTCDRCRIVVRIYSDG